MDTLRRMTKKLLILLMLQFTIIVLWFGHHMMLAPIRQTTSTLTSVSDAAQHTKISSTFLKYGSSSSRENHVKETMITSTENIVEETNSSKFQNLSVISPTEMFTSTENIVEETISSKFQNLSVISPTEMFTSTENIVEETISSKYQNLSVISPTGKMSQSLQNTSKTSKRLQQLPKIFKTSKQLSKTSSKDGMSKLLDKQPNIPNEGKMSYTIQNVTKTTETKYEASHVTSLSKNLQQVIQSNLSYLSKSPKEARKVKVLDPHVELVPELSKLPGVSVTGPTIKSNTSAQFSRQVASTKSPSTHVLLPSVVSNLTGYAKLSRNRGNKGRSPTGRQNLMKKFGLMNKSRNNCTRRLPKALIIGVMKSGTEAFSTFLALHPDVAMQYQQPAIMFFNNPGKFGRGVPWYLSKMPCSSQGQITIDKSPQYWPSRFTPGRVYMLDEKMKLLVLVRNPVERAVSHFLQYKNSHKNKSQEETNGRNPKKRADSILLRHENSHTNHAEEKKEIRQPMAKDESYFVQHKKRNTNYVQEETFREAVLDKAGTVDEKCPFIAQSKYAEVLQRWLEFFPMNQILFLDGDNFKRNPVEELKRAEKFLGIKQYFREEMFVLNQERKNFCFKRDQQHEACLTKGKGRMHPNIDDELKHKLKDYFKPYNEIFFEFVNKTFDW